MTERLYYTDSYKREFEARVLSRSSDGLRVTLDRTAFYPTSGGQQFDTGTLNTTSVVDVVDEDDHIVHILAEPLTADAVSGSINWTRRFDHMQQHTGQHVLSAVFEDLFGYRTASVHFGINSSSIDLETPSLGRSQILEVEARANAIVRENHPVAVSFENAATVTGLRKPPPREGQIRVITIADVDRSACGGTHVRSTAEIGAIVLRKPDRMHGNARIEFLCGDRTLRQARADFETLSAAALALGVGPDEIADRATALANDLRESERIRKKLSEELAAIRAKSLYQNAAPDHRGVRWIAERLEAGSLDDLRTLAHTISKFQRAAFIGVIMNPPQLMFATSEDSGIEAGKVLKNALNAAGGRGGGSARVAQGTVPAEMLESTINRLSAD